MLKITIIIIAMLIVGLILELPAHVNGQFWKNTHSEYQIWERETLASRESGICYKFKYTETLDPALRQRQFSYCCEGYMNHGNAQVLKCVPMCSENCTNGVCISPGNCECGPGFYRQDAQCLTYEVGRKYTSTTVSCSVSLVLTG